MKPPRGYRQPSRPRKRTRKAKNLSLLMLARHRKIREERGEYVQPLADTTVQQKDPLREIIKQENSDTDLLIHEVKVEVCLEENLPQEFVLSGNRIVDLNYVLSWSTNLQYDHSQKCPANGKMVLINENRKGKGLTSLITFECDSCGEQCSYSTEDPLKEKPSINVGAVWGILSTGGTHEHLQEFLNRMDVPGMSKNFFSIVEKDIANIWK